MTKVFIPAVFFLLFLTAKNPALAWGRRGHQMVAELAYRLMDSTTKQKLRLYLGTMTPDEAGNWMDDQRSNSFYEFMRTWHYLDFEKGEEYKPVAERNILTVMNAAYNDLKHLDNLNKKDIKKDLLLLFHLIGDLHQPLHVGYASDRGGNDVVVASNLLSGNLHSIWDTQIIELKGITLSDCIQEYESLSPADVEQTKKIGFLKWFKQSRSLLDSVYGFQNNFLDQAYVDKSAVIIKKQLVLGGIRLASVLTDLLGEKNQNKSAFLKLRFSHAATLAVKKNSWLKFQFLSLLICDERRKARTAMVVSNLV